MNKTEKTIHFSLASYPGRSPIDAIKKAYDEKPSDPMIGELSLNHVQICPQNCIGRMTPDVAVEMKNLFPETQFRLHANVKVDERHNALADLSRMPMFRPYFDELIKVSTALDAPAYTIHAGNRNYGRNLDQLFSRLLRFEDQMGIPVGVEGLYPINSDKLRYWLDCWDDYRQLLDSNVHYAIDLSHLNIVKCQSGIQEDTLVSELISSERCIEIHVSANEGDADSHNKFSFEQDADVWWKPLLSYANEHATIFYEGDLVRQKRVKPS